MYVPVQPKGETEEYVYVSEMGSLICGSLAGIGAKMFVYPLDVARKRLQIQGFQHGRIGFGKVYISGTCNRIIGTMGHAVAHMVGHWCLTSPERHHVIFTEDKVELEQVLPHNSCSFPF